MAQFHFYEADEKRVNELVSQHSIDEAMSLAGGALSGDVASQIVVYAGVKDGMDVLDFGCGPGRVAQALAKRVELKSFLGVDVVQPFLDYARTQTPTQYQFVNHREMGIPAPDASFDVAYAFGAFSNLLQQECFIYLQDIARVLKPQGRFVLSFLEMADGWATFQSTVDTQRGTKIPQVKTFIERSQVKAWAGQAGFEVIKFIDADSTQWDGGGNALGQTVAILEKY